MIKTVDIYNNDFRKGDKLYRSFSTRIESIFGYEQSISDVLLYEQYDENGNASALILNSSGSFIVLVEPCCDTDEIREFICACAFSSVLSNVPLPIGSSENSGYVMHCCVKPKPYISAEFVETQEVGKIHRLLGENFDNVPEFSFWYADMLHRIRRKTAVLVGSKNGSEIVSSATCSFITEDSAIINCVCTSPDHRKKGLAFDCINRIISYLAEREVENAFVFCRKKMLSFYENMGFENIGEWYEYLR